MPNMDFELWLRTSATPLSDLPPDPETTAAWAGTSDMASREDHRHPRLASTHSGLTLDGSGLRTVTFTRSFIDKPAISMVAVQASATQPVVFEVVSYVGSAGNYTGVNVKGYKAQTQLLSVLGLTVNTFGGSAAGIEFTLIAVQIS